PHIIALLADDLGWHDTAPRNPAAPTPVLAKLAREGITLDRHYVFRFCSPTRRALLTGRLPTSLTTSQPDGADLCSDFLPLALPLVSEVLAAAGYACHFIGKGHLGYETTDHLPVNRGFATHVGYLGGSEGYAHGGGSADSKVGKHDLWRDQGPAFEDTATMSYSTDAYAAEASKLISRHDAQEPMFMYLAFQSVHAPWTLPPAWQVRDYPDFPFQTYANMLALMDEGVGNVTRALQEAAMWEDTLLLFTSDNGGVGAFGNNFPLHGHKHDPYEGGTRAAALVAGGFVPQALRGTTSQALVHVADWFPTFAQLA
ncbi:alkaline-phosphatase-like protein, partial [Pelagophyceae sp. CCMP2097]